MVQDSSPENVEAGLEPPITEETLAETVEGSRRSPSHQHRHSHHNHHRRHRRHHRHRHHRSSRSSRAARYEKSILHFGTAHIVLGIICVVLQMVQFTNNSVFSQAQPGLWCGTFFVITGSVCLGLASTKGIYSTLAMMGFGLISLFMALTLSSLSWFGAEMATYCQSYWKEYCADSTFLTTPHPSGSSQSPAFSTIQIPSVQTPEYYRTEMVVTPVFQLSGAWGYGRAMLDVTYSSSNESTNGNQSCPDIYACCKDLAFGACGYDIGLGRTMHSLLVLCGVAGCTTSFILTTLACSRPGSRDNSTSGRRPRLSSIFAISGNDHLPTGGRPITPWEFPPPSKEPLPRDDEPREGYPDEPPPPYDEEHNNPDSVSYL